MLLPSEVLIVVGVGIVFPASGLLAWRSRNERQERTNHPAIPEAAIKASFTSSKSRTDPMS
jgi:hypothetical protein